MYPRFERIGILGVGLLGGSIGMALKQRNPSVEVIGCGRSIERLQAAKEIGAIDAFSLNLEEGCRDTDLIIACTPVKTIPAILCQAASFSAGAMLTDAGSTKGTIVASMQKAGLSSRFVGSHPMAGSDKSGVEYSSADLFEGRIVIVTPNASTPELNHERIASFWESLGAKTVCMSPEEHDRAVALISHLPHVLASALARFTPSSLLELAASGWASTTRVAAGDPELWLQIVQENRQPILDAMRLFSQEWKLWEEAITSEDWSLFQQLLNEGQRRRREHS